MIKSIPEKVIRSACRGVTDWPGAPGFCGAGLNSISNCVPNPFFNPPHNRGTTRIPTTPTTCPTTFSTKFLRASRGKRNNRLHNDLREMTLKRNCEQKFGSVWFRVWLGSDEPNGPSLMRRCDHLHAMRTTPFASLVRACHPCRPCSRCGLPSLLAHGPADELEHGLVVMTLVVGAADAVAGSWVEEHFEILAGAFEFL